MQRIERVIEQAIFRSRWLLAPFYLGLIFALVLLFIKFAQQLFSFILGIGVANENDVILQVLTLIDLAFTGNLVLIVIFSGYENFISKIDVGSHDRPDWMTKVDFSGLKQKLMISIVAISAIQLLKAFMNVEKYDSERLAWLVGIHVVFVGSMLVMSLSDWLAASASSKSSYAPRRTETV